MDSLLSWGIGVVLWCQQFSPELDFFFKVFTILGDELFFLLFVPLIIWCVDYTIGVRMALMFLSSAYLNSIAKLIAAQPRPFQISSDVLMLVDETTGGFPSGHTQNTTVVWAFLAIQFKKRWFWILTAGLLIMVPLSRIYLGVHFPTDLLGGYMLGIAILITFMRLEQPVLKWLKSKSIGMQLLLIACVTALLTIASIGHLQETSATIATLLGGGTGLVLERRLIHFNSSGNGWQRILRFLIGTLVLGLIYFGLKILFSHLTPYLLFRFIRYTLVGLAVFLLMPWLFIRLKLA